MGEKITMRDVAAYCTNDGKDIKKYFLDNNIVEYKYFTNDELLKTARFCVDNACIRDGNFYTDTVMLHIFYTVMSFYIYTNIEFDEMTFSEAYDIINQYHLISVLESMFDGESQIKDLERYCINYMEDMKYMFLLAILNNKNES